MARALVILADGCEEIEAVTVLDVLRRGGVDAVGAALAGKWVHGNHGIGIEADVPLDEALHQSFDMLILPGGQPGAAHLAADARIQKLLQESASQGRYIAAICAAPGVLAEAGLLQGRKATSFPGAIKDLSGISYVESAVVRDGKVVTSRGPGTAMDFALQLLELLTDAATRDRVAGRLQRDAARS
ncbi:MAG TPA: DJ-1 family glyoxalase III [Gammaproteobacteria bacterium]|nr:DJ-1 family glyoxalase III [Gammaproteobacteria bacterium]